MKASQFHLSPVLLAFISMIAASSHSRLTADEPSAARYSDEVVAKADKILTDAGLRRSGKTIVSTLSADIARAVSGLSKSRRALQLTQDAWKLKADQLAQLQKQAELINTQNIQINTQLAQPGLAVTESNRLVAMNNANVAKLRLIGTEEERVTEQLATDRKTLNDAEAEYAETVLAIRRDLNGLKEKLQESLDNDQIKLAFKVSHTNFGTPENVTSDQLLVSLEKRLKQVEQEIFSESIALDVTSNGTLYVNVSVGKKVARMVVDSGATVISLPAALAAELGVIVPNDAPVVSLVLADGREIPGRAVKIPKVRIGQFEAEQVDAAVLDAVAVNAEPLLGMSFLGNFKFEIDIADKSLKLLRVKAD
jgi:clan AA aspartic protease (TIGR02281 family)